MNIEQQIKQKKFTTPVEKAFVNIAFTQSYLTGKLNKAFKPYNISMQQFNVLRILKGQYPKPVCINDIADRMIDKMSNASRLVEKLRLKSLIERRQCSFDKRQVDVQLTGAGLKVLEDLNALSQKVMLDFNHISHEEYLVLNNILDKMRDGEL